LDFACYAWLEEGYVSYGAITSNSAEQTFKLIKPHRGIPVIDMCQSIICTFAEKHVKETKIALERADSAAKVRSFSLFLFYHSGCILPDISLYSRLLWMGVALAWILCPALSELWREV
jgi:hypothetical protein